MSKGVGPGILISPCRHLSPSVHFHPGSGSLICATPGEPLLCCARYLLPPLPSALCHLLLTTLSSPSVGRGCSWPQGRRELTLAARHGVEEGNRSGEEGACGCSCAIPITWPGGCPSNCSQVGKLKPGSMASHLRCRTVHKQVA